MGENEAPGIVYDFLNGDKDYDIEQGFKNIIDSKREDELRRASNLCGPHRDDFIFEIDGINLRNYGSQGQHKTFQTALRFAQFFYLKEKTGKTPIFLLDDVFGELDINRSIKISDYLKSIGQAFITLTDFTNFSFLERGKNDMMIKLNNGEATYA
jgi:DNA replication and repair protein RecF